MKRVKAWAAVDKRGELTWAGSQCWPEIYKTEPGAQSFMDAKRFANGERVVPVVIVYKEVA